jgi:acetoin utilization deacetylase AcuC-like enzyme
VHRAEHVRHVEELAARGGGNVDPDTVVSSGSYEAALHAAGGAARLADLLLGERDGPGFCGLRPPGHHAEVDRGMGFCLFNNVAVAARRARDEHGCGRVLILDWDVHHGNGTEDVFADTDEVLFVSIHRWPFYPGTGAAEDTGRGAGAGHTVNLPVPAGAGDDAFVSLVEHVAGPLALAYQPGLVLVSAGYDAHRDDPVGGCRVTEQGFAALAAAVRRVAERLDVPYGGVLEGGYDLGGLARSVSATLRAWAAGAAPGPAAGAPHPLAADARARLAATGWPQLAASV